MRRRRSASVVLPSPADPVEDSGRLAMLLLFRVVPSDRALAGWNPGLGRLAPAPRRETHS